MTAEQGAAPTSTTLSSNEALIGSRMLRVLERFRELDPEFQIQQVCMFLMVGIKNGRATKQDIAEQLGISIASATRTMQAFSKTHRSGKKGHDMFAIKQNPANTKQYLIELNAKGRRFYRSICEII